MNKILLCTNLDLSSESAEKFAVEIARQTGAAIILVHSYYLPVPIPSTDPTFLPIPVVIDQTEEEIKEQMNERCAAIRAGKYGNGMPMQCEAITEPGTPLPEVTIIDKKYRADLIVMGSRNVHGMLKIFGTTATKVIDHTSTPALIIPHHLEYSGFNNILYATDLKEGPHSDTDTINESIGLAKAFNSSITFVHVSNPGNREAALKDFASFKNQVNARSEYDKVQFEFIESKNPAEGLEHLVSANKADLLILLKTHLSLFRNIFHKSTTREIIFNSEIPVMVFHH